MKSYLGDPQLKVKAIEKLKTAMAEGKLVQDMVELLFHEDWEEDRGTVMGCISESNDRETFSNMYGFPEPLTVIQDHIFQFLSEKKARKFAVDFLEAIPVGVDLNYVWKKYFIWLLIDVNSSVMDALEHIPLAKDTIELSVKTLKRMLTTDIPIKELEGIIETLNAQRSIVGSAADAGALEPGNAGWILANAHWSVQSYLNADFAKDILPKGGSKKMWNFLAKELISLIETGEIKGTTFEAG